MSLRSQLAYLAAGLTLMLGLLGLLNPLLTLQLAGLEVIEPRGLGQARALFGALFLTMGGYMLWALSMRPRAIGVLRFAGLLWLASGVGRLSSFIIDGTLSVVGILLLAFDLAIGIGALLGSSEPARPSVNRTGPEDGATDPLKAYRS